MAIRVSFLFSRSSQPSAWGPASLGAGFLNCTSLQLVWSPTTQSGVLRARSAVCWLSRPHHFSNTLISKTDSLPVSPELYKSSTSTQYLLITGHRNMHFRRLWNGMFDRHRAEITAMQFTGHSLPVHQFVTVLWGFNPVPYCQPSSPTPMEYSLLPSLEWHVWPGRRSIYYTRIRGRFAADKFLFLTRRP